MPENFAVLTPSLVPALPSRKVLNIGDGFILRAIERRIGSFEPRRVFTSWRAPSVRDYDVLKSARATILAGANQLNDHFTVWPGLTAERIRSDRLRLIPFGIGLQGNPDRNRSLSEETKDVLRAIHADVEYSSWRCPQTKSILDEALPELRDRFLMTGCPVIYDRPLLESTAFPDAARTIAVTITDRGDFWERETAMLESVAHEFPRARRYMVVHQDYRTETILHRSLGVLPGISRLLDARLRLRQFARNLGYTVVVPDSADAGMRFYRDIDFHFGSRLHAHLYFLSQNKRSFLVPVDRRSNGFAEFLHFPLCEPRNIGRYLSFDFEKVRSAAQAAFSTMTVFVKSIVH